ncbi:nucleoside permease [Pelobium manganitolerans]|uniref:Nucleoside permease n=1 Tax=Pelobium manganitolerans TaxID=1842495 RepID=A0A419S401_9SPHI|nr:nucleoside permease [Pelobium manganitolerans]RKD14358.1 nucleoside permease [Pelobium manganitolerans]
MGLKTRLIAMNFLQFFVWGAWLISLGGYMIVTLNFTGVQVGSIFSTMGVASLFMPAIMGIISDRFFNAERVLGVCHIFAALLLLAASKITDYPTLYIIMLFNSMLYMPTIALANTVSYNALERKGFNIVKSFPPIRVWGTIGFIAAMWIVDFLGWTKNANQLYVAGGAGILLGLYAFTMPKRPPLKIRDARSLANSVGLDAFVLFRNKKMAVFFTVSMFLGAALQITNLFGGAFLDDFKTMYPHSFGVQHPNLLLSISQISETLFILTIPFFLQKFGIKKVMLLSIFAWVLRFSLFGIGNPGNGLYLLVFSMIVYGMAFDFFNISGSLFVERESDPKIRASAQGLFMIMTNGLGAFFGGILSGWVVDYFTTNGVRDWQSIWFSFSGYALVLAVIFPIIFKYKHIKEDIVE